MLGVLRERGEKGLPCERLYRQMFNVDLYLMAYGRLYANQGRDDTWAGCGDRGWYVTGQNPQDY